jgi:hypothetical protein
VTLISVSTSNSNHSKILCCRRSILLPHTSIFHSFALSTSTFSSVNIVFSDPLNTTSLFQRRLLNETIFASQNYLFNNTPTSHQTNTDMKAGNGLAAIFAVISLVTANPLPVAEPLPALPSNSNLVPTMSVTFCWNWDTFAGEENFYPCEKMTLHNAVCTTKKYLGSINEIELNLGDFW